MEELFNAIDAEVSIQIHNEEMRYRYALGDLQRDYFEHRYNLQRDHFEIRHDLELHADIWFSQAYCFAGLMRLIELAGGKPAYA